MRSDGHWFDNGMLLAFLGMAALTPGVVQAAGWTYLPAAKVISNANWKVSVAASGSALTLQGDPVCLAAQVPAALDLSTPVADPDGTAYSITRIKSLTWKGAKCGLVLPESLQTIDGSAFQGARFSGELVLPANVKSIGYAPFNAAYSIGSIVQKGDALTAITSSLLVNSSVTNVVLESQELTEICERAFVNQKGCFEHPERVTIDIRSPKLRKIGKHAFAAGPNVSWASRIVKLNCPYSETLIPPADYAKDATYGIYQVRFIVPEGKGWENAVAGGKIVSGENWGRGTAWKYNDNEERFAADDPEHAKVCYGKLRQRSFLWFSYKPFDEAPAGAEAPDGLKIVVMLGQSNMAGYSGIDQDLVRLQTDVESHALARCWKFSAKEHKWKPCARSINDFDNGGHNLSLGSGFMERIVAANPGVNFGVVNCAWGGMSIGQWEKGMTAAANGHYDAAIKVIREAQKRGKIVAFLWHQGCNDMWNPDIGSYYPPRFKALVDNLKADLGLDANLPVVLGEIHPEQGRPYSEGADASRTLAQRLEINAKVNAALASCTKIVPNCAIAPSKGLARHDWYHFTIASAYEMGHRFWEAYRTLAGAMDATVGKAR